MARRPAQPKLGNRWALDYIEPPAKRAVYAQRLWALRCYRSVTTRETAMLAGLSPSEVEDLQSDPGRKQPGDSKVRPFPQQRERLAAIALALHVHPAWLCGSRRKRLPVNAGIVEYLGAAAQAHALREYLAGSQRRPAPWMTTWAWMERVESAWHLLLTQPRDTCLIARLTEAVLDKLPLPKLHRADLLQRPAFPSLRLRLARDLFPAATLAQLGAVLLDDAEGPTATDIASAQAAVRRYLRRAQAVPAELHCLVSPGPSVIDPEPVTAIGSEAQVLLDAVLGAAAYPQLAQALVAARLHAAEVRAQRPRRRLDADAETADDQHRELLYRAYATRFPHEAPVDLPEVARQFRHLRTAMQMPCALPGDVMPARRPARRLALPLDARAVVLDLLGAYAGRVVESAALVPELSRALGGVDPQPVLAELVRHGWVLRREARMSFLLITDADDRRLRPKQAWKAV